MTPPEVNRNSYNVLESSKLRRTKSIKRSFSFQANVATYQDHPGDHPPGERFHRTQENSGLLLHGATPPRDLPPPQLRLRHTERRVRDSGAGRVPVLGVLRPGLAGNRREPRRPIRKHHPRGPPPEQPEPIHGNLVLGAPSAGLHAHQPSLLHQRLRAGLRDGGGEDGGDGRVEAAAAVRRRSGHRRVASPHQHQFEGSQVVGVD